MAQDGLYPERVGRRRVAVVAAVIVTVAVVGAMLLVFALVGRHDTGTAGQVAMQATLTALASADSYCDKTDMEWYAICSTHQDTALNIRKTIKGGTFTINAVYADSNQVLLSYTETYTSLHIPAHAHLHASMLNMTLTTQQGIQLSESREAIMLDGEAKLENAVVFFDTSTVPTDTTTLNLHVQIPLQNATGNTITASFSAPFHKGRIANLNQKETVNGIAITLQKAVVTLTQTRLYLLSNRLSTDYTQISPYSLTVGDVDIYRFNEAEPIVPTGKSGPIEGVILAEDSSLMSEQGQWTLNITPGAISGESGNGTWIFHFTVPA